MMKRTAIWLGLLLLTHLTFAQESRETVQVDDVQRTYLVRLPKGYNPQQHYPVVILLHAMDQNANDMERLTQFDDLADKNSIIAIYPNALHGRWNVGVRPGPNDATGRRGGWPGSNGGGWPGGGNPGGGGGWPGGGYPGGGYPSGGGYPGGGRPGGQQGGQNSPPGPDLDKKLAGADDLAFFNQMLDDVSSKFSVDASRIYATGISEGGLMTFRMGCALGDRLAAIAPVGAAMPKTMTCLPSHPMPVVMINGKSDPIVPFGGGREHNLDLPIISVEDSAKMWAKMDRCSEKPDRSKVAPHDKTGTEMNIDTYKDCTKSTQVLVYGLKGTGNTWPGGEQYASEREVGKTSRDIDANQLIWSFLGEFHLESNESR